MMYSLYSHSSNVPTWGLFGMSAIGLVLLVVMIALKGFALWHAAKRDEKWWFIAMLIINTAGILEIVYLIFFVKIWPNLFKHSTEQKRTEAPKQ